MALRPAESADLRSLLSDTLPVYHAPDRKSAFQCLSPPIRLDQTGNSLGTLIAIWNTPSSVECQLNFTGSGVFWSSDPPPSSPFKFY